MTKTKNKMLEQAIVAVFTLVVVIGILIYYKANDPYREDNQHKAEDVDNEKPGEIVLTRMDPATIQTMEIVDNTDEEIKIVMRFENQGGQLKLEEREASYKTDNHEKDLKGLKGITDNVVRMLECTVTTLKALRIIEKNPTNVEEYGMDDPTCSINMVLRNGETKLLKFGKRLPTTPNAYYFMMNDDNKVYVVSKGDLRSIVNPDDCIINVGG